MRLAPFMLRHAVTVVCVPICMLFSACASEQTVDNFDRVSEGMSMDQVHEELGPPSSTWQLNSAEHGIDGARHQWGDNLSSVASSAMYRDSAPERVYSVTFDKNGQVVSKSYPLWAEPK